MGSGRDGARPSKQHQSHLGAPSRRGGNVGAEKFSQKQVCKIRLAIKSHRLIFSPPDFRISRLPWRVRRLGGEHHLP